MNRVTLNNGVRMPQLGYGVYLIEDAAQCEQCVSDAIEVGYRSIDTAASYLNEKAVGAAIRKSGILREELFITGKVWVQDSGYENTKRAVETSLKNLGLDYFDLYLIHQPFGDVFGSWRAMTELYHAGTLRAIGVSNFSDIQMANLAEFSEIAPAVNQIEIHPFYQQSEREKVMKQYGVQMEAWGPLAEGQNNIFENETLKAIAAEHGKSVAQVILRWHIQRGIVVIPKSVKKERMIENINIWDFELTDEDMAKISAMDTHTSLYGDMFNDVETLRSMKDFKIHE